MTLPQYGVFVWRGDGRYSKSDAVKTFVRKSSAQKFAEKYPEKYYVVRALALIQEGK